jgi:isoamylase
MMRSFALAIVVFAACTHPHEITIVDAGISDDGSADAWRPALGAHYTSDGNITFRVASNNATRIELDIYDTPTNAAPVKTVVLDKGDDSVTFETKIAVGDLPSTIYYGYRVWGPNWPYDPAWMPGSTAGWLSDVDTDGNRMNPNKLVFDPYATELSHDPETPTQLSGAAYSVGGNRAIDSGPVAPKGIVVIDLGSGYGAKPTRAFRDDVVYEVHVRGFTKADPQAGACAGTYAGAATRAAYLASLGVTRSS